MQNKGLIRFLAWAFVLVCLYQLSYTFVTSSVNRKAKKAAEAYAASETTQTKAALLANGDELAKQVKLDSLQTAGGFDGRCREISRSQGSSR